MSINSSIVQSAQATLTSVAFPNAQSVTSASWKAVIGEDASATSTEPFVATQTTPSGDITTTVAPEYLLGSAKCQTRRNRPDSEKIYLTNAIPGITVGMVVTSAPSASSGSVTTFGVVASTSTASGDISSCAGSAMMVTLTQGTASTVNQGDTVRISTGNGAGVETTICSSQTGAIYLSNPTTTFTVGMPVYRNSSQVGTVAAIDPTYAGGYCNSANVRIDLSSSLVLVEGDILEFGSSGGTQVIGHIYTKVVSLNNTGTRDIQAVTITHTNSATTLELCTGVYSGATCSGTASAISPGLSQALSLPSGSSAQIKVTLSVEDLVTTLSETLTVTVSSLQVNQDLIVNS
ncbi:MAG: hypothetical protein K9G05_02150 [Candidatus Nanopelagicales bacterium]|nr:hypothetical protein [Candidatus Nanopelagicales bacterium]MCF8539682.1 hypothetical protein [Candidatus Nanopelagicales bacterium]MCF8550867.1 hypothetical protein [Candidatus Nanopelagicales bacterium]